MKLDYFGRCFPFLYPFVAHDSGHPFYGLSKEALLRPPGGSKGTGGLFWRGYNVVLPKS